MSKSEKERRTQETEGNGEDAPWTDGKNNNIWDRMRQKIAAVMVSTR